jgi:hypothetical protein
VDARDKPGHDGESQTRRHLPVIASEAKQYISRRNKVPDGLLRRCAPRNDVARREHIEQQTLERRF